MRICDVVKDSIWYDPRVRKQIDEYRKDNEVVAVGVEDNRLNWEHISKIPCQVHLVKSEKNAYSDKRTLFTKIKREITTNRDLYRMICEAKPDIIHANDLNALIPAYKAAKKLKCKLIYDTHEIFLENPWIARNKIVKMVWAFYEKRIIKKADLVVCVSNAAAEYFKKKYKLKNLMVITNCALERENIKESVEKNDGFEVLNHGQFYEGRGYDIMVESVPYIKDFPEIKLALRGFGTLEESLKQRAEQLATNNIIFYPKVLVQELITMASKSHVGVAITEPICLNFELSVSNKLFEYAAAGLPVIMSDIPEHRYLNDKYHFGILLRENTPQCFVEAIKKFYSDKEFYAECAKNAKLLSAELNWEKEFNKLITAEKELLNSKK